MVYLTYPGMQNVFLTEKPDFTHFKTVYTRDAPSISRTYEIPFEKNSPRPGDLLICPVPQKGDYLSKASLKLVLPKLTTVSNNWIFTNPPNGTMYGFDQYDNQVFSIILTGLNPKSSTTSWYKTVGVCSISVLSETFVFESNATSVVFSSQSFANMWGFVYNPSKLFGGYVKYATNTSQVTLQESGWLRGDEYYTSYYSYINDICYKVINSIGLYIGNQLVQEFDSNYIKFEKEISNSYKNRPVLSLLEGDSNIVDIDRIYYFEFPLMTSIPMHAIPRHDVQIRLKLNPLNYLEFKEITMILDFNSFSTRLPSEYTLTFSQVSLFNKQNLDVRGPIKQLFIRGDSSFEFKLNGEYFCDSDSSNVASFDNHFNIPVSSNTLVFNNPINMSRIRDQKFESANTVVYAETLNVLRISNELAGIAFDSTETSGYPVVTGDARNPFVAQPTYLFNEISDSVPSMLTFYSMRLVNPVYTGPVIRLRNIYTDEEADFYTDRTQSFLKTNDGISIEEFGTNPIREYITNLRVSVWYDQTFNNNHTRQTIKSAQPYISLIDGLYVVYIYNDHSEVRVGIRANTWLEIDTAVEAQQFIMFLKWVNKNSGEYPELFSLNGRLLRYNNGSIVNDNAADWQQWPGTSNCTLKINETQTNVIERDWNAITSFHFTKYDYSKSGGITRIGSAVGYYNIPKRSYNGYIFECGFLNNTTLSTDDSIYNMNTPFNLDPDYITVLLAGSYTMAGYEDGQGSEARFYYPQGLCVDSNGNIYVSEYHTIRKITPNGEVTTLAGFPFYSGFTDGQGSAALFNSPQGLCVDSNGNIYVSDSNNHTIRKITPNGEVTTFAGVAGESGTTDGRGSEARFYYPLSSAIDSNDNIYVLSYFTIRKITPNGEVTTLAGSPGNNGYADGQGSEARFYYPQGLCVDSSGTIFIADTFNNTIRKITPGGNVTTLAGLPGNYGNADGQGSAARFYLPYGLCVDSSGTLFVADSYNNTIRKITPGGNVTTVVLKRKLEVRYITVDNSNNLYKIQYQAIDKLILN